MRCYYAKQVSECDWVLAYSENGQEVITKDYLSKAYAEILAERFNQVAQHSVAA